MRALPTIERPIVLHGAPFQILRFGLVGVRVTLLQIAIYAATIVRAHLKQRDMIYVLGRWRLIMAIITAIPEAIFKRLSL